MPDATGIVQSHDIRGKTCERVFGWFQACLSG